MLYEKRLRPITIRKIIETSSSFHVKWRSKEKVQFLFSVFQEIFTSADKILFREED